MDRHSATSAIRVGKHTAWKVVMPTILVLAGLQPAIAQSTLRIASAPQTSSAEVAPGQCYGNSYAQPTGTTTEIRIVEPSNLPPATRLPVAKTHDLFSPLSSGTSSSGSAAVAKDRSEVVARPQNMQSSRRIAPPSYAQQGLTARQFNSEPTQPTVPAAQAAKPVVQVPAPAPSRLQPFAPRTSDPVAFRPAVAAGESTIAIVEVQPTQTPAAPVAAAKPAPIRAEGSAKFVATVAPEQVKATAPERPMVAQPKPAKPEARIAMTPPAPAASTGVEKVQRSQRTLAIRLFASGLKDIPTASPRPVGAPSTEMVAVVPLKVTVEPIAVIAQAPAAPVMQRMAQAPAAAPIANQPIIKPVPESHVAAKEPTIAIPAEMPKVAERPKPERSLLAAKSKPTQSPAQPMTAADVPAPARKEIFSAPMASLPKPQQASQVPSVNPHIAAPGRVASTNTPALANDVVAGVPLQQPRIYRPLQQLPLADSTLRQPQDDRPLEKMEAYPPAELAQNRVATLEPVPARKVPAAVAAKNQSPSTETFTFADRKQPAPTMVAQQPPAVDHKEMMLPESAMGSPEVSVKKNPVTENEILVDPMDPSQYASGPCSSVPFGCPYLPGQSGAPNVCGVDCGRYGAPCNATWGDSRCIPWSLFGPGEYVGPARTEHVSTYYLRVNDLITLTYINSRKKEAERYRIGCGDRLGIEWLRDPNDADAGFNREVVVQPDGTIVMPLVGEVNAVGNTVPELSEELVKLYGKFQRDPQITVTPLETNMGIRDVIQAVTSVSGSNGQTQALRVTPEGTIQASGLGSVFVQGLTLDELRSELEARYASSFGPGLLVSPALTDKAISYVFVGGEVKIPSRYTLEGPTTVMQAITMAGGWNIGGNLHQVVVFRRDENWCLKAIKIDVRAPLYGKDPCPANDVWLRDNDLVIVPKSCVLCATDVINLYFTRGVYAVFPINYVYDFTEGSAIVPVP